MGALRVALSWVLCATMAWACWMQHTLPQPVPGAWFDEGGLDMGQHEVELRQYVGVWVYLTAQMLAILLVSASNDECCFWSESRLEFTKIRSCRSWQARLPVPVLRRRDDGLASPRGRDGGGGARVPGPRGRRLRALSGLLRRHGLRAAALAGPVDLLREPRLPLRRVDAPHARAPRRLPPRGRRPRQAAGGPPRGRADAARGLRLDGALRRLLRRVDDGQPRAATPRPFPHPPRKKKARVDGRR